MGTIGIVDQFLNDPVSEIKFVVPKTVDQRKVPLQDNGSCTIINKNYGYWNSGKFVDHFGSESVFKMPYISAKERLKTLLVYGDSLQYRFLDSLKKHPICQNIFTRCIKTYTWTYKHFNKDLKIDASTKTKEDFNETKFILDMTSDLTQPPMRTKKSLFVVNFGIHNVGNIPLQRAFNLFQLFIQMVRKVRKDLKENCPLIVWKTTTPPAIENAKKHHNTDMRFITKQVLFLY